MIILFCRSCRLHSFQIQHRSCYSSSPQLKTLHWGSLQSCPTLCDPMDCSPPGSSVHGILQARILECVAMPSSRKSFWPRGETWVLYNSCTAGRFCITEPPRKPPLLLHLWVKPRPPPSFFWWAYKTCSLHLPLFNPKQLHWFLCWSSNIAGSLLLKDLYLLFPLPGQLLLPGSYMAHSFPYFKSSFKYLLPSKTFSDPIPFQTAIPATMTTSAHTLPICYGMNCVIWECVCWSSNSHCDSI